jgi:hypothetical protein
VLTDPSIPSDLHKVAIGIGIAVLFPPATYVLGFFRIRATGSRNKTLMKLWATFCLLLYLVALAMLLALHLDDVRGVWEQTRILAIVVYVIFGLLVPAGIAFALARLWRASGKTC